MRAEATPDATVIWIVLPAYNEEENISAVLHGIHKSLRDRDRYRVLVINDGSTDKTVEVAEQERTRMPVRVVSHAANQGLAQAVRTGLTAVVPTAANDDALVIMDADNSHPADLIPRLVEELHQGADVVIASRFRRGSRVLGVPVMRRVLSHGASLVFRLLFPLKGTRDYTGGFRAYRVGIIRRRMDELGDEFLRSTGFSVMTELLLKLRSPTLRVREVPLVLRYDLKRGKSKLVPGRTIVQYLGLIQRELGRTGGKKLPSRHPDP